MYKISILKGFFCLFVFVFFTINSIFTWSAFDVSRFTFASRSEMGCVLLEAVWSTNCLSDLYLLYLDITF